MTYLAAPRASLRSSARRAPVATCSTSFRSRLQDPLELLERCHLTGHGPRDHRRHQPLLDPLGLPVEGKGHACSTTRGRELKARATTDVALRDIAAARDAVAGAGRVGVIGYCWGGFIAWMSASRLTGFACAVPYYGGGMTDAIAERPKCPVMAHFGDQDHWIPMEGIEAFTKAHPEVKVHVYPANHGFNCDQRGSYNEAAATLARERSLAFFAAQLA